MEDSTALPVAPLGTQFAAFVAPLLAPLAGELDPRLCAQCAGALLATLIYPRPSRALMLTTFAEQSARRARLLHTVKRFYRLLHHPSLSTQTVTRWLLDRGPGWDPAADELVLIDGSELTASRMRASSSRTNQLLLGLLSIR